MTAICLEGALTRFTQAGEGTDPLRRNYGLHVGDEAALVHERRRALAREMGADLIWMNQTHSADVAYVHYDRGRVHARVGDRIVPLDRSVGEWGPLDVDGIVVDTRGWEAEGECPPGACVMVADCMPILFSCPQGVIAAVHAGRVGLATGIVGNTLAIYRDLGISAEDIHGIVGPCVCGSCYEVSSELRDEVAECYPEAYAHTSWGTPSLDLPAAAAAECARWGVRLEVTGTCTVENKEYHSYRRQKEAGRHVGVICRAMPV